MAKHQDTGLMQSFGTDGSLFSSKFIVALVVMVVLGGITGFFLANSAKSPIAKTLRANLPGDAAKGQTYGSDDLKTYKDSAEGIMQEGGIDGEGQYHLVRPGGDSQNVYLTSSLVDLSQFNKRKIKVWGQTQAAQKAGWLMDVGRVQVLE